MAIKKKRCRENNKGGMITSRFVCMVNLNCIYMLSYAFQVLNEQGYKNIATEQFNNTGELMAAILEKGIAIQLKRGLGKEYIPQTETLSSLRGKIDIAESIKTQSMLRKQLICTYDEFSVNSFMNRIIKSTVELLLRSNISKQRKKNLRKLMVYFSEVDFIDLYTVNWNITGESLKIRLPQIHHRFLGNWTMKKTLCCL